MSARTVSIATQVKQLQSLLGTGDLTAWQQDFVRSVVGRMGSGTDTTCLSGKQVEVIAEIYRKHFA
jgi:hypothetical protein